MKVLLIVLLSCISTFTFAQREVTWKGGTPGFETNWNDSRNWSDNRVPNEFSDVIIPDVSTSTFSYPVIEEGDYEVNSIRVAVNAHLTIETAAQLIIYTDVEGLTLDNATIEGSLLLLDEYGDTALAVELTSGANK